MKWLGDGVMFCFRAPGAAVLAALELVEGVGRHGLPRRTSGIHAGPVVFQDGDYFGRTVNLGARIADYARPGEVLVSQEVVGAADGGPMAFSEIGAGRAEGRVRPDPDRALDLANTLDSWDRARVLPEVASSLAWAGQADRALDLASSLDHTERLRRRRPRQPRSR